MRTLLTEYIPHAPNLGLHVAPNIPGRLLENARSDYASSVDPEDVIVLYDATLLQSGKDGALFLEDRFVFQNHDFDSPQLVRYDDIVGVQEHSKWFGLGGAQVDVDVNQGRATVTHSIDFSGKKEAAPYVMRFLQEAMAEAGRRTVHSEENRQRSSRTNVSAVRNTLENLVDSGDLTREDLHRMMNALRR